MERKRNKDISGKKQSTKKAMRDSSLQDIGDALGLTRMRICQLEKIILKKIKDSGALNEFDS